MKDVQVSFWSKEILSFHLTLYVNIYNRNAATHWGIFYLLIKRIVPTKNSRFKTSFLIIVWRLLTRGMFRFSIGETKLVYLWFNSIYLYVYTIIVHWIKNPLRRTSEHNYEYNYLNLIFSLEKICFLSTSNFYDIKNWF